MSLEYSINKKKVKIVFTCKKTYIIFFISFSYENLLKNSFRLEYIIYYHFF